MYPGPLMGNRKVDEAEAVQDASADD
jgi:hypothetical protein